MASNVEPPFTYAKGTTNLLVMSEVVSLPGSERQSASVTAQRTRSLCPVFLERICPSTEITISPPSPATTVVKVGALAHSSSSE